jgi:hypothetical protein
LPPIFIQVDHVITLLRLFEPTCSVFRHVSLFPAPGQAWKKYPNRYCGPRTPTSMYSRYFSYLSIIDKKELNFTILDLGEGDVMAMTSK